MKNYPKHEIKRVKCCFVLGTTVLTLSFTGHKALADKIIPAHPDAVGGGNPLQGLGRPDDPLPSRVEEHLKSLKKKLVPDSTTTDKPDIAKQSKSHPPEESAIKSNTNSKGLKLLKKKGLEGSSPEKDDLVNVLKSNPGYHAETDTSSAQNQRAFVPAVLNSTNEQNSPHRKALRLIQSRKYAQAQTILEDLKLENPGDLKARYLLAIIHVLQGQNKQAQNEYQYIINHTSDLELKRKAETGLKNISKAYSTKYKTK